MGLSGLQLLYSPTRVKGPLRKIKDDKGLPKWESISWSLAIEEVAKQLMDLRAQGRSHTVASLVGQEDGTVPQLLKRLIKAYGSPHFYHMPSVEDTQGAVLSLSQGIDGFVGLDVENADYILSFGSALLDGFGSPLRMMRAINRLKEQKGTLVQIEPRLSNTAAKADLWLAAKPGTEADLALGMAHVLINQRRFNEDFIYNHTEGFELFAVMVRNSYTPEAVAVTTGIDAATITQTALAFAAAKRPLAIFGHGKGQAPGSMREAAAVNALNALVGNINRPGGLHAMPAYDYIDWPAPFLDGIAYAGFNAKRVDGSGTPSVHRFFEAVDAAPEKLQLLMIAEANPSYSLTGCGKIKQAIKKIPFVVSFSSFMDETAMQADLILPNHLYLERWEDIPMRAGAVRQTVGLCRPVVAPQQNTQHLGDTVIQIAKALKGTVAQSFPWDNYYACLKQTMGNQWQDMNAKGAWEKEPAVVSPEPGFKTESGKLVMMNEPLKKILGAIVPAPEGDEKKFPLQLVAYDSIRLSSGYIGNPPFMNKVLPDTVLKGNEGFVELNPETAGKLGLAEGQSAILTTPHGQVKVRVHLNHGIMPGLLAMARGLGHTAYDGYLSGKGVNTNELIGPVEDPASGLDAAWGIQAILAKA